MGAVVSGKGDEIIISCARLSALEDAAKIVEGLSAGPLYSKQMQRIINAILHENVPMAIRAAKEIP